MSEEYGPDIVSVIDEEGKNMSLRSLIVSRPTKADMSHSFLSMTTPMRKSMTTVSL